MDCSLISVFQMSQLKSVFISKPYETVGEHDVWDKKPTNICVKVQYGALSGCLFRLGDNVFKDPVQEA